MQRKKQLREVLYPELFGFQDTQRPTEELCPNFRSIERLAARRASIARLSRSIERLVARRPASRTPPPLHVRAALLRLLSTSQTPG